MGFRCLPRLVFLGAIAGIGFGGWLIVALAAAVAVVGFVRWRRTGDSCPASGPDDAPSPAPHATVLSPARGDCCLADVHRTLKSFARPTPA